MGFLDSFGKDAINDGKHSNQEQSRAKAKDGNHDAFVRQIVGGGFIVCAALAGGFLGASFSGAENAQGALFWVFLLGPAALGLFRWFKSLRTSEQVAKQVWFSGWIAGVIWAGLLAFRFF